MFYQYIKKVITNETTSIIAYMFSYFDLKICGFKEININEQLHKRCIWKFLGNALQNAVVKASYRMSPGLRNM